MTAPTKTLALVLLVGLYLLARLYLSPSVTQELSNSQPSPAGGDGPGSRAITPHAAPVGGAPPVEAFTYNVGGFVYDESGQPLAGVLFVLELPGRTFTAASAEDGSFALGLAGAAMATGAELVLRKHGYASLRRGVRLLGPEMIFYLERGGVLEGLVIDAAGDPIAGAVMEAAGPRQWRDITVTDESGAFVIFGAVGPWVLIARSPLYADLMIVDVEIERGATSKREIRLAPGSTLRVRIVEEGSAIGVAGARVRVSTDGGDREETTTNAEGSAELHGLGAGAATIVVTREGSAERIEEFEIRADGGIAEHTFALSPAWPCLIEVLSPDKTRAPRPCITIRRRGHAIVEDARFEGSAVALLAADRDYVVQVTHEGFPEVQSEFRTGRDNPSTCLVTLQAGGRARGRVIDDFGRAAIGLRGFIVGVERHPPLQQSIQVVQTSHDGTFRSEYLAPGEYRLTFDDSRAGNVAFEFSIQAGVDNSLGDVTLRTRH